MATQDKPWFKSWPKGIPKNIDYPVIPLHEILSKTANEHPKKIALAYLDREITYGELDSLSDHFAVALKTLEVERGDRVAIFLPNTPQFVIAYFGILKAGAIVTAMNPLHKEREVEHQLLDSSSETIIVLDSLLPTVQKVWQKTSLKQAIVTDTQEYPSNNNVFGNKFENEPKTYSFQKLLSENSGKPSKTNIDTNVDVAALQYTGGTTGTTKGAMLTHMNLVSNAVMFATWIRGAVAEETFLTALPLFHIYGMTTSMNVPIYLAAKMVLLPKFDPTTVLETIQKHKVTVFCGVPTMYGILLTNPELERFNLTSLRVCISGASSLPVLTQKRFMEISGGLLAEGYGLTEASPVTHCNPVDKTLKTLNIGSIGLPLPDTDSEIVDVETGERALRPGEIGELIIKGPQIMKGYWKNPEETAAVLRNGWLYTGDLGRMDVNGYFYITDRKKDLIKYKDYSVYPRELEDVLYEHSAVKLCAVAGKPDAIAGEIPKAFVVLKEGARVTGDEIMKFVNEKVAPYKAIREVEFRKDLPLSSIGKVLRRTLQEKEEKNKITQT